MLIGKAQLLAWLACGKLACVQSPATAECSQWLIAGIIRRAAEQILATVEALRTKLKPGESITLKAYALELYNEELRDLSTNVAGAQPAAAGVDGESSRGETGVRIAERPIGRDGRCIPEVGATH